VKGFVRERRHPGGLRWSFLFIWRPADQPAPASACSGARIRGWVASKGPRTTGNGPARGVKWAKGSGADPPTRTVTKRVRGKVWWPAGDVSYGRRTLGRQGRGQWRLSQSWPENLRRIIARGALYRAGVLAMVGGFSYDRKGQFQFAQRRAMRPTGARTFKADRLFGPRSTTATTAFRASGSERAARGIERQRAFWRPGEKTSEQEFLSDPSNPALGIEHSRNVITVAWPEGTWAWPTDRAYAKSGWGFYDKNIAALFCLCGSGAGETTLYGEMSAPMR